jgi:hypothetical protein
MVVGSVGGSVGVARGQWTDLGWSWCGGAVLMASSQLSWSYGRDGQDLWDQPCLDLPVIPRRQWLTKSPQRRDRVAGSRAGCLTSCMPLTSQPLAPHHSSTRSHTSALLSTRIASRRHGAECGIVRDGCWRIAGSLGHEPSQRHRPDWRRLRSMVVFDRAWAVRRKVVPRLNLDPLRG